MIKAYESNDFFLTLISQLRNKADDAGLAYFSSVDKRAIAQFAGEIDGRILLGVQSNAIGGIGVAYRVGNMAFESTEFVIEAFATRKEAGRRKNEFPNSINQAVIRPTMERGILTLQVATASLILSRDGLDAPRLTNSTAAHLSALPSDEWVAGPDEADISRVVRTFTSATRDLRRAASLAAQTADKTAWAKLRAEAQIRAWQIDLLMPVKKSIVAVGCGREILHHALTGPEAHIKRLGKNGLPRDVLLHRMWSHALATQCAAPPLIKL